MSRVEWASSVKRISRGNAAGSWKNVAGSKNGAAERSMSLTEMVDREALAVSLAAPTSDLGRVTMIVLGACWIVDPPCNGFGA